MKYKEDKYLIYIFIIMSLTIVAKSYFHTFGYLSPDSTKYLELAQNLLDGNGFTTHSDVANKRVFFTIWPIGYPTLIFLVSLLSGLSVFWSSKVLSIIFVGLILLLLRYIFRSNAYIYSLLFFLGSFIEMFSFSWSESMFILFLLWYSFLFYRYLSVKEITFKIFIGLIISSLMMFLSRYIGGFSIGVLTFGVIYLIAKKEKTKALFLLGIVFINVLVIGLYFYHNYLNSSYLSGLNRVYFSLSFSDFFYNLLSALLDEMVFISNKSDGLKYLGLLIIQMGVILTIKANYKIKKSTHRLSLNENQKLFIGVFLFISILYLGLIIMMITTAPLFYRFLAPGTFLIFIGGIYYIYLISETLFNALRKFIIAISIISFLINVPINIFYRAKRTQTYYESINPILERYKDVPINSIVIFPEFHLNYLRADLTLTNPKDGGEKEEWNDFVKRINPNLDKSIFINMPSKPLTEKYYHKTVVDFVNSHSLNSLVQIRQ